jgi:hypothetical protein
MKVWFKKQLQSFYVNINILSREQSAAKYTVAEVGEKLDDA